MPIGTPEKALLLTELPTATVDDKDVQAIVATNAGAKKMPIEDILQPYYILVGSYVHYSFNFPINFAVPLLGGILDPEDFEDHLQTLKQRIPHNWILNDGRVQLPLALDHVLQQDIYLQPGEFQSDAQQNVVAHILAAVAHGDRGVFKGLGGYTNTRGQAGTQNPTAETVEMDLSRSPGYRTADKVRENTINTLLCILTGRNKAAETKRYYLIDPNHGEYLGWFINLAVGRNGQGIGYNALLMTENEPTEYTQSALADMWGNEADSDPLGLAMQMKAQHQWPWEYFDQIYRTFRINGKEIFIIASTTGIQVIGNDGNNSITFLGSPAFETNFLWGSHYGVAYISTSVLISGHDFPAFNITGLSAVDIWFRAKAGYGLLSLKSNDKILDDVWWNQLLEKCPPENKDYLVSWLTNMPAGIFNSANVNDGIDKIPRSRFYFYSTHYTPKSPSQHEIRTLFQTTEVVDHLGIYDAVRSGGDFSLSDFLNKEQRTFYFLGKKFTVSADRAGVKWQNEEGYYWQIKASPEIGSYAVIDRQNTQVRYQVSTKNWYFGGPDIEEINTTDGYSGNILIFVKENLVLLSMGVYFDVDKVNTILKKFPEGREEDLRSIFEHLPKDWENTLNQDNVGLHGGTKEGRFWMINQDAQTVLKQKN